MHTFINWTAVSLLNPPSCTSKQTLIYNSHDLWSIRVPKYLRLLSHSFIHAATTDKVKLDVDALDDFIQNLLMCLLCAINLKPLGVSKQSVASAALLLLGKNDKLLCKLQGWWHMHINGRFPMSLHFDQWKINNCWMFCSKSYIIVRLWIFNFKDREAYIRMNIYHPVCDLLVQLSCTKHLWHSA